MLTDSLHNIRAQAQKLREVEEAVHAAQCAQIQLPGSQSRKLVSPYEMLCKGYLGTEMAGLGLILRGFSEEIAQLPTLVEAVGQRLQVRNKRFLLTLTESASEGHQSDSFTLDSA